MRKLCKVELIGPLADICGKVITIGATDIKELFNGIMTMYPDTRPLIDNATNFSLGVINGEHARWMSKDDLLFGIPDHELLVFGLDIEGAGVEITTALIVKALVTAAISMAVSWAVSRIVTLYLTDKPETADAKSDSDSYLLSGQKNSTTPGSAVPLVFGRFRAGSVIISQTVSSERMGITSRDNFGIGEVGTHTYNILNNDTYGAQLAISSYSINGTTYSSLPATVNVSGITITATSTGLITVNTNAMSSPFYYATNITYNATGNTDAGGYTTSGICKLSVSLYTQEIA